ncbi:hypothetical protein [Paenibacillus polymyxa]|uniref:hypothetical protein n=1 Tax=Paenibacillus polymyxa TaxID=1406 RepID=UPI0004DFC31F|nr:hypothetical protein [Paenibacillus polymyxa]
MDYEAVILQLKERFPPDTVVKSNRGFIPNQVYTDRLEAATGGRWSLEVRELDINPAAGYIKAIVRVYIGDYFRDGYGIADLTGKDELKIANATDLVINQGFVNAVDSWQMGWKDLASYREWAKNPALAYLQEEDIPPVSGVQNVSQSRAIVDKSCTRCGKRLSQNEVDLLKAIPDFNHSKLSYCFEHLPDHFKRRVDPFILQRYTDQMNS